MDRLEQQRSVHRVGPLSGTDVASPRGVMLCASSSLIGCQWPRLRVTSYGGGIVSNLV